MSRIAALDVGDAFVGIAASDELCTIATPVRTIRRTRSVRADVNAIESVIREIGASKVVVGLPLDAEGEEGIQAAKVKDFANRLAARLSVPVEFWDERFSTADAEMRLLESDTSRAKLRQRIHAAAAAVVLESYLSEVEAKPEKRRQCPTDETSEGA
ncbi:MAG: Holliday junction resolvase RuvX [Armatimonadota bacterium]